jgi:acyl-CoA reductase-like NAD-dependent aldehyde dehydrogenase
MAAVNNIFKAATLTTETGKTLPDARSEVRRGIDMIQTAAATITRVGERGEMKSSMQVFTDRYPLVGQHTFCEVVPVFTMISRVFVSWLALSTCLSLSLYGLIAPESF